MLHKLFSHIHHANLTQNRIHTHAFLTTSSSDASSKSSTIQILLEEQMTAQRMSKASLKLLRLLSHSVNTAATFLTSTGV